MSASGWWQYSQYFSNQDLIDQNKPPAETGSGEINTFTTYGNSNQIQWELPSNGYGIFKDGTSNYFPDWGLDTFNGFGSFRIEYGGLTQPLNVAKGNVANGDWQRMLYQIGPYQIEVDTGYLGSNIYRMTVSEATGLRPELVFRAGGAMGTGAYTDRTVSTFQLAGESHFYVKNAHNTPWPLTQWDPVFLMTVVPMAGEPYQNLFTTGSAVEQLEFNKQQTPLCLPFTVYMCAHRGGADVEDSFFEAVVKDHFIHAGLGTELGEVIPLKQLREVWFEEAQSLQGNGNIQYEVFHDGIWKPLTREQGLLVLNTPKIRVRAKRSIPDAESDAQHLGWKLTGYENSDCIFHG